MKIIRKFCSWFLEASTWKIWKVLIIIILFGALNTFIIYLFSKLYYSKEIAGYDPEWYVDLNDVIENVIEEGNRINFEAIPKKVDYTFSKETQEDKIVFEFECQLKNENPLFTPTKTVILSDSMEILYVSPDFSSEDYIRAVKENVLSLSMVYGMILAMILYVLFVIFSVNILRKDKKDNSV